MKNNTSYFPFQNFCFFRHYFINLFAACSCEIETWTSAARISMHTERNVYQMQKKMSCVPFFLQQHTRMGEDGFQTTTHCQQAQRYFYLSPLAQFFLQLPPFFGLVQQFLQQIYTLHSRHYF
eukprot:Trichotokara_eunicae@DN6627_c0_g1_i1.p1